MSKRLIMVILANDAVKRSQHYVSVGPNSRARVADVARQYELLVTTYPVVWAFGAGADALHSQGPTLAELNEAELRRYLPDAVAIVNRTERSAYGTFEEIEWVVTQASRVYPNDELVFVFWSQARHLTRVRVIVRWFFPGITAQYRPTAQTKEIPLVHEIRGYGKLVAITCGLRRLVQVVRRYTPLRYDDA